MHHIGHTSKGFKWKKVTMYQIMWSSMLCGSMFHVVTFLHLSLIGVCMWLNVVTIWNVLNGSMWCVVTFFHLNMAVVWSMWCLTNVPCGSMCHMTKSSCITFSHVAHCQLWCKKVTMHHTVPYRTLGHASNRSKCIGFKLNIDACSGGSRISPRWGHQPFRGGRLQHTILSNFPKNCMKLKEFGRPGASLTPPLDPPLVWAPPLTNFNHNV